MTQQLSRRNFIQTAFSLVISSLLVQRASGEESHLSASTSQEYGAQSAAADCLEQFSYGDIALLPCPQKDQFEHCLSVIMNLSEDSMLRPYREIAGLPAPGESIGGWYAYNPKYDSKTSNRDGFAPGHCFGQWISAMARAYAINKNPKIREKLERLLHEHSKTVTDDFFYDLRFPAYTYDKIVCALIDSYQYADFKESSDMLKKLTSAALPHLPPRAIDHGEEWNPRHKGDDSYTWDESYTLPENLFLAYQLGLGEQYSGIAQRYLQDTTYFEPLSRNVCALTEKHAYSYANALSSAMLAYMVTGSHMHLQAAQNAFTMISTQQSFATGGWGPDERFRAPGKGELGESLTKTHNSFETPCGSYAHFKLTRYLLRTTRDGMYGDSMERVMYNTVLGALPLTVPGKVFYYADNNMHGKKVFHNDVCPCCAGTLPQVAADYGINSYFRDASGIYVNLFVPSSVSWSGHQSLAALASGGASKVGSGPRLIITQSGRYPLAESVAFEIAAEKPIKCSLRLRIPAWCKNEFSTAVNGATVKPQVSRGFATISRIWYDGDRIELNLPMRFRLEPVDDQHPNLVALMRGPLVLFAVDYKDQRVSRDQLLAASRVAENEWSAPSDSGPLRLLPFTAIGDENYSTYVSVV